MNALQVVRALGPVDARGIWRDPLLKWLVAFALALGLIVRFGLPALTGWLAETHGFDLVPYWPLVMSGIVMTLAQIAGTIVGFLLLDQRDDGTLTALSVTPLPPRGYLAYRLATPLAASVVLTVATMLIAGGHGLGFGALVVAAIGAAPLAPLFALYLAAFASNKVQGFALAKANGFLTLPPLLAWFVEPPHQYWFGLVPTYWPAKLYWQLSERGGGYGACLALGFALAALVGWPLIRRFERVARLSR